MSKVSRYSVNYLVDIGANGGVSGNDVGLIATYSDRTVDICGIDNHEITAIPLISVGGVTSTISGVIDTMNQNQYHRKNKTTHSSPQMEHCKNKVDDRSIKVGGGQHMTTLDY